MAPPCKRTASHQHSIVWSNPDARIHGRLSDRCRSLHLWSTLAFHVLAGDSATLDGEPFTDVEWAERYLAGMEADRLAKGTARRLRKTLAYRAEKAGRADG